MRRGIRRLVLTACLMAGTCSAIYAQQPPVLPASPAPVPSVQPIGPPILGDPQAAAAAPLPPTAPAYPLPPVPSAVPAGPAALDPGRDGWANIGVQSKPEGLFLNGELEFLFPYVKNQLSATLTFPNGSTDRLNVPQTGLDFTVSPRFELGYHLPSSLGDLLIGYQFLVTEGHGQDTTNFGSSSIKSRLDINQFDIDYATATYSPLPRYDLKFRIGARLGAVYLDSEASNAIDFQQASNYFVGAGPSATIDFEHRFKEVPELGLYFRLDGAALTGQVRQKFRETIDGGTPGEEDAFFSVQKTQTSEVLTLQAGFIYRPFGEFSDRLRITGGYELQQWWGVGKLNGSVAPANVSSDASITTQGIYLRGEYDF